MNDINTMKDLAWDLINNTSQNVFLTGKAGTGKTTFLKELVTKVSKNHVVLAPTGVAAINAGGTTIHSMFYLPFVPLIPTKSFVNPNIGMDRNALRTHFKYREAKIDLLDKLELLIIDEISMVRADVFDAIDFALQTARKNSKPFGGVQVLLIGDLYQLPPVVGDSEREIINNYYETPFFFSSKVYPNLQCSTIELNKIYRQKDEHFIQILNNIRDNKISEEELQLLNNKLNIKAKNELNDGNILLSTHNYKVDEINNNYLNKLESKQYIFKAEVENDFPQSMYPMELELKLKVGAQVMFTKNNFENNYYNGKIGEVKKIEDKEIIVQCDSEEISVKVETWENTKYKTSDDQIVAEVGGKFKQYPLRLAWAITIHKSQGLTFEKAIIDAAQSFTAGQVYVALSRCTNLEYLQLSSKIEKHVISTDERILQFINFKKTEQELTNILLLEKEKYAQKIVILRFSFVAMQQLINKAIGISFREVYKEKSQVLTALQEFQKHWDEIISVADKFQKQLESMFLSAENKTLIDTLKDRCGKACNYFIPIFEKEIVFLDTCILDIPSNTKILKKIKKPVSKIIANLLIYIESLSHIVYNNYDIYVVETAAKKEQAAKKEKRKKTIKGETQLLSLDLYKSGKSIEEIAIERNLSVGTIEGHLATFVGEEIEITQLVSTEKMEIISAEIAKHEEIKSLTEIKTRLDSSISWGELKAVFVWLEKQKASV